MADLMSANADARVITYTIMGIWAVYFLLNAVRAGLAALRARQARS